MSGRGRRRGALAVQIVHSNRRGSREIEHFGSVHSPEGVEALRAAARQRLHANQETLDFGDGRPAGYRTIFRRLPSYATDLSFTAWLG